MGKLKTKEEAKIEIRKRGISVSKWARENSLDPSIVYAVLHGKVKGLYGESHRASVLLGIKENNEVDHV